MNNTLKNVAATTAAAAIVLAALPAFASTPAFSLAKPNSGMSVDSFDQQVQVFNRQNVADLLHARSVSVVKFDTAWNDGGDAGKAFDALNASDQSIHLLREALKADPAAMKLLARNHVAVDQVIDIAPTGNGSVQLYIS
ncbi:hypothetical protein [Devosia sp. A16]|uniref:hypothetical protein n=1 Tax=Devosia sp. A16 TaxID=1736675 RepID=UPI000A71E066|nr:hypothetical protein [Devosia sp. A16]